MEQNNFFITIYSDSNNAPDTIILPKQIHGDKIIEVVDGSENLEGCDALITENKSFQLGIKTADCAAICFANGGKIGIAHIGWRGLCLSLIEKMLGEFNSSNPEIFIGPFMHSFEIQKDFCFDTIKEKFGEKFFTEEEGKVTFLFKDAIMSLLPPDAKFDERNTFLDLSLPSFRRDKTKERLTTVISFK